MTCHNPPRIEEEEHTKTAEMIMLFSENEYIVLIVNLLLGCICYATLPVIVLCIVRLR